MELSPELADGENVKPVIVDDLVPIVVHQILQVLRGHAFIDKQFHQYRIFSQTLSTVGLFRSSFVLC